MSSAPSQLMGYVIGNGWTNAETFVLWLELFHEYNKNVHELRVAILDSHHSHKTLEASNGARAHGSTLIILAPHITHEMYIPWIEHFKAPIP